MGKKAFLAIFLWGLLLNAHAPKTVELSYDGKTAELRVRVAHRVSDPVKHFVGRITVRSGKELLAEKTYERQETAEAQTEVFVFGEEPPARGTPLTVTAYCSISGEASADLEWE